jgi:glycosyltransferase involved in cell wall biosynthesis
MRDNTLAAALTKRGVDIQLIPTYTPIRTDEESVAIDQVFFGGLNVYLQNVSPIFRWLPRWLDRLLDQPRLISWLASRGMETSATMLGDLTVSMLQGERGRVKKEVFRLVDWLAEVMKPDLVGLTNILIGGCIPTMKRRLDVPIVVTLQGDDLFLLDLIEPYKSQAIDEIRRMSRDVDAFVVFSQYYADFMADLLRLDRSRMHIVPMGIHGEDFKPVDHHATKDRPMRIGYLARVCPAKGLHLLIDAWARVRRMPGTEDVELVCAGWLGDGDRAYFAEQVEKVNRLGLAESFTYRGVIERVEKVSFLSELDVFSVPTTYREPKGLFALEAMASGVPVVLPAHGAFPEMLAGAAGGVLHEPGNIDDLAQKLHHLLTRPGERAVLGQAGREGVLRRHAASAMAEATQELYASLLTGGPSVTLPLSEKTSVP